MKKKIIIIGAGPAGLSAAYTILKENKKYEVIIVEEEMLVGGLSKTVSYNNNKMDLGGHRFFSKMENINNIWEEILPIQGKASYDDKKLGVNKKYKKNGPDPEKDDAVLLIRNRFSRIYYRKHFYDYPITLKLKVFRQLGLRTTLVCGFSYLKSVFFKKDESNLENFYINRFGKKLYSIFFEGYTEKLWGKSPKDIDSSWGSQRVKGLSIKAIISDYLHRLFKIKNKKIETSLIEEFYYPKYGPGEMWSLMADKIIDMGGKILLGYSVKKIKKNKNSISEIICQHNGETMEIKGDIFISSMPIKDLFVGMNNVPKNVKDISLGLPYRDFMTIGLILKKINLKNNTNIKTLNNIVPDCWIYVQGKEQKLGRIQIFNNWSPYLVNDVENTISLGLEYFCMENDTYWSMKDSRFKDMAVSELINMGIIDSENEVLDYHVERVKKAYPAYFDTYKDFNVVKDYLNKISNLYCIGRNGQHRYNNMDHSMQTGILAAKSILGYDVLKDDIWNVNSDNEYHEEKKAL